MTWKGWLALVLVALVGGFVAGVSVKSHKLADKAAIAEQKAEQLAAVVKQELAVKQQQTQAVDDAKAQAAASDAKATKLLSQWNHRPKPLPPLPPTPGEPVIPVTPSDDALAQQTIDALKQDVDGQKTVVLKLTAELATDKMVIDNQQKELNLKDIVISAQVSANKNAQIKGVLEGGGAVAVAWAVAHLVFHF